MECRILESISDIIGEKSYLGLPAYIDRVLVLDDSRRRAIDDALRAILSGKNVLIVGDPGVGKSTILYAIWRELRKKGIKTCYVPIGSNALPDFNGVILLDDLTGNYRQIISQIPTLRRGIILATARIGEIDVVRNNLRHSLIGLEDAFFVIKIKPFSEPKAIESIVIKHLSENGIRLEDGEEVLNIIVEKSEGYPIFIYLLVNEAKNRGISRITKDYVETIPKGITRYVETILTRIIRGIPQYHSDRAAQDLSLLIAIYLASKYVVGPIHIDFLRELYVVAYARLTGTKTEKIPESIRIRNPISDFAKHLIRVGKYLYMFPHQIWRSVIENPSGQILSVDIQRLRSVIPEEEMEEMFVRAYNTAYLNYVRPSNDDVRIDEYASQKILIHEKILRIKEKPKIRTYPVAAIEETTGKLLPEKKIAYEERGRPPYQAIELDFVADYADIENNMVVFASRTGRIILGFPRGKILVTPHKIGGLRLWKNMIIYYYWDSVYVLDPKTSQHLLQSRFPSPIRKIIRIWKKLFILTAKNNLYELSKKPRCELRGIIDASSIIFRHREYLLVLTNRGLMMLNEKLMQIGSTIHVQGALPTKTIDPQVIAVYTANGLQVYSPDGSIILREPTEGLSRFYVVGSYVIFAETGENTAKLVIIDIYNQRKIVLPVSEENILTVGILDGKLVMVTPTHVIFLNQITAPGK